MKRITATRLRNLGACRSQVRKFRRKYPRELDVSSSYKARYILATRLAMEGFDVDWLIRTTRATCNFSDRDGTFFRYYRGQLHSNYAPAKIESNGKSTFYRNGWFCKSTGVPSREQDNSIRFYNGN